MAPDDQTRLEPHIAAAVRDAYVRPIDGPTARQHLNAIVAATREPVPRRRRRPWRALVATATAAFVLPAGLAIAGVNLPAAVKRPYRAIGIVLPHQPGPAPVTRPIRPVATSSPSPTATPEQGTGGKRQPASGAARGRHRNPSGDRGSRPSGRGNPGAHSRRGNAPSKRGGGNAGNPNRGNAASGNRSGNSNRGGGSPARGGGSPARGGGSPARGGGNPGRAGGTRNPGRGAR